MNEAVSNAVIDAVDQLQDHLRAYQAIEQIVTVERAGADTHLPLLERQSLSSLLGILNRSTADRCRELRKAASAD